jgi:hypothetical protein
MGRSSSRCGRGHTTGGWAVPSTAGAERTAGSRVPSPVGELARPPTGAGQRIAGAADTRSKSVPPAAPGRGQAVPDPPARQGRQTDANGCGGASTIAGGAVGSERPGLKPRAQSASPLKGAVRRTAARVDRRGADAVGISRLQPAWGLSPAVNGRAIVETGARLVCAACRARRVGYVESPRLSARSGEAAPRPYKGVVHHRPGVYKPHIGGARPPVM